MQKKGALIFVIVFCLGALIYLSLTEGQQSPPPLAFTRPGGNVGTGQPSTGHGEKVMAPDFTLESLAGGKVNLKSLKGKVVLVNFWSSTCPPCIMEMPAFEKLYKTMSGKPFEILAVTTDSRTTAQKVAKRMNLTIPVLLDSEAQVTRAYGSYMLPETYIIDPDGKVDNKILGAANWGDKTVVDYMNNLIKAHEEKNAPVPADPKPGTQIE